MENPVPARQGIVLVLKMRRKQEMGVLGSLNLPDRALLLSPHPPNPHQILHPVRIPKPYRGGLAVP